MVLTKDDAAKVLEGQGGIVIHWTAGGKNASPLDQEHYHFLVTQDPSFIKGVYRIADNDSTGDHRYAAHTKGCNTRFVGVSLCGMRNAVFHPFSAGPNPITEKQLEAACLLVAEICRKYSIPVKATTVLTHAEVQANLGIKQNGKWDIARLPWTGKIVGAKACGDHIRTRTLAYLNSVQEFPYRDHMKIPVTLKTKASSHVSSIFGWLDDGETMVDVKEFMGMVNEQGIKASYLDKPGDDVFICYSHRSVTVEAEHVFGRIFVPLRETAEACGLIVSFLKDSRSIKLDQWG